MVSMIIDVIAVNNCHHFGEKNSDINTYILGYIYNMYKAYIESSNNMSHAVKIYVSRTQYTQLKKFIEKTIEESIHQRYSVPHYLDYINVYVDLIKSVDKLEDNLKWINKCKKDLTKNELIKFNNYNLCKISLKTGPRSHFKEYSALLCGIKKLFILNNERGSFLICCGRVFECDYLKICLEKICSNCECSYLGGSRGLLKCEFR